MTVKLARNILTCFCFVFIQGTDSLSKKVVQKEAHKKLLPEVLSTYTLNIILINYEFFSRAIHPKFHTLTSHMLKEGEKRSHMKGENMPMPKVGLEVITKSLEVRVLVHNTIGNTT